MKLSALFDWYRETREYRKLATNSKIMYEQMMQHALTKFMFMNKVERINERTADDWYDELVATGKTNKAVATMKVLRRIWNVAKRKGVVDNNPFEKMGLATPEPRSQVWSKDIIEMFRLRALKEGKHNISLLIDMSYNLGQRPGDLIKLPVKAYNQKDEYVTIKQQKTGTTVQIPVYSPFKERLKNEMNNRNVRQWGTFLPQYHYSQYNKDYRLIRDLLLLPNTLQLRDIRRTVLTEILETGASDAQGQSISGHVDRDQLNTYGPYNLAMARSAMEKRFGISKA